MLALPSITEAAMKNNGRSVKYVAFDLDPNVVISGFKAGKSVLYGDGSQPMVLSTAGIETPKGFIITYNDYEMSHKAVERLREAFPSVPILCRAVNTNDYFSLLQSGSTKVIMDEAESSMRMCSVLLTELGIKSDESDTIIKSFRDDFELESRNELEKIQMQKGLVVLVQDISTSSRSSSSSTETVLSVSANKENADTSEVDTVDKLIDELGGVTICPIPNKK
jgi:voltage-gated potassium channel Kch